MTFHPPDPAPAPTPHPHGMLQVDLVRAFLARRDEPCPGCSYNLRGLTSDMCPECGHSVRLCILRPHRPIPRLAVWLAFGSLAAIAAWSTYGLIQFALLSPPPVALPANFYLQTYLWSGSYIFFALVAIAVSLVRWKRSGPEAGSRGIVILALLYWFVQTNATFLRWLGL